MPTDEELARQLDWIPKKRYLELFKETEAAVLKRIANKHWKAGEQYSRPAGGGLWISLKGVSAWAAQHAPEKSGAVAEG